MRELDEGHKGEIGTAAHLGLLEVVDLVELLLEHKSELALVLVCPTPRSSARLR